MVYDTLEGREGAVMTVKEVSELTGVSVRALHHYDRIGLFKPARVSEAGYRLYDEASLGRLQLILLYRELEFPLKDIRAIVDSPDFDRNRALDQQIELLKLRREHLDNLIALAASLRMFGVNHMSFEPFDMSKIDEYVEKARNSWGDTPAWREYEQKRGGRGKAREAELGQGLMALLAGFGRLKDRPAGDPESLALARTVRDYITEHFYTCTSDVLRGLAALYAGGGSFTENIDRAGGLGTAKAAARALEALAEEE